MSGPICKDCRWFIGGYRAMTDSCSHPSHGKDLVNGNSIYKDPWSERARGRCGEVGALFTPLPKIIDARPKAQAKFWRFW